jgi:hypothetical protein
MAQVSKFCRKPASFFFFGPFTQNEFALLLQDAVHNPVLPGTGEV